MLTLAPEASIKTFTDSANDKAQSVVYLTTKDKIIAAIAVAGVIIPLAAGVLAGWGILLSRRSARCSCRLAQSSSLSTLNYCGEQTYSIYCCDEVDIVATITSDP